MPTRRPPPADEPARPDALARLQREHKALTERLKRAETDLAQRVTDLEAAKAALEAAREAREALEKARASDQANHRREQVQLLAEREALASRLKDAERAAVDLRLAVDSLRETRQHDEARGKALRDALEAEMARARAATEEAKARLAAVQAAEQALEADRRGLSDVRELERKLAGLVAINRDMQDELDGIRETAAAFRTTAEQAEARVAAAVASVRKELGATNATLQQELAQRAAENASLLDQLQSAGRTPFLSPEQVSSLLGRFYTGLGSQFTGLDVREGELRLKVAFAGVTPEKGGLVVPTPATVSELQGALSEIVVRLGVRE